MYTQTVKTKPLSTTKSIVLTLAVILCLVPVFIFMQLLKLWLGTDIAGFAFFLMLLLGGYFLLQTRESEYVYTFAENTLVVERKSGRRVTKSLKINVADIISLVEGKDRITMLPRGEKSFVCTHKNGSFSFAPDKTLLDLLNGKPATDCFIDANRHEIIENLKALVNIPSVKECAEENAPFGKPCARALEYTLKLCESLGMKTKCLDGYCGWAEIGEGDEMLAILAHLDVVPPVGSWDSDPFVASERNGKLFGRGTADDKGPAIAAIFALASLKEQKFKRRVRLIFGCDEECGSECMKHYKLTEEEPTLAFSPDAEYPVVAYEKGIAHFKLISELDEGNYQLYVNGGSRPNIVPDLAHARVIGNIDALYPVLMDYDCHSAGISFSVKDNTLDIEATGVAAHGSTPQNGKNAFFALFDFLCKLNLGGSQGAFCSDIMRLFSPIHGEGIGCIGDNTLNLGICYTGKNDVFLEMRDDSTVAIIDIRYSETLEAVTAALQSSLPARWDLELITHMPAHRVDPQSELVLTLSDVYAHYTGRNDLPLTIGGGTYARSFENAVAFGALFVNEENTAHMANEYISIDSLLLNAKIFAYAIQKFCL